MALRNGLLASVVICSLLGCGDRRPTTYPVTGIVAFEDGSPVPFGMVEFRGPAGEIGRAKLDDRGRFEVGTFSANDGAVAGSHQLVVVQHLGPNQASALSPRHDGDGEHAVHDLALVSPKFASYGSSPLVAEVEPGAPNNFVLKVERFSPPGRRHRSR